MLISDNLQMSLKNLNVWAFYPNVGSYPNYTIHFPIQTPNNKKDKREDGRSL